MQDKFDILVKFKRENTKMACFRKINENSAKFTDF